MQPYRQVDSNQYSQNLPQNPNNIQNIQNYNYQTHIEQNSNQIQVVEQQPQKNYDQIVYQQQQIGQYHQQNQDVQYKQQQQYQQPQQQQYYQNHNQEQYKQYLAQNCPRQDSYKSDVSYSNQNVYQQQQYYQRQTNEVVNNFSNMTLSRGFDPMFGNEGFNLLSDKNVKAIAKSLYQNSDSDIMRCTLNKIPESASILQKSRLPLGLLMHPFKSQEVPVIHERTIVRCKSCKTYINSFAKILDQRRWQCNLCLAVNSLPDDFLVDSNGYFLEYPFNQPELTHNSVEYVASADYMVRPPQAAAYLFVFDCSIHAHALGYLPVISRTILNNLNDLPGDLRTLIGFIGFDSNINFFNLGGKKPFQMIMSDILDPFIPCPDDILVNLNEKKDVVEEFLKETLLNLKIDINSDTGSALGPALTIAYKILSKNGGRITVFQADLPNKGTSKDVLTNREDPNNRTINSTNTHALTPLLNPITDFYKKLALDCNEHHVAIDLFNLCPTYSDLATIGQVAKISSGSIFYYGNNGYNILTNPERVLARFESDLEYYLTRDIGFEAVLRIRCTKGLNINSFFGNFFVRSVDLLALPNCDPDSGVAVQFSIDDDLKDFSHACFQAAILYTSTNGERRIKVHTISVPIVGTIHEVVNNTDQEAITCLLVKMATDRTLQSNLNDSRESLINSVLDILQVYKNLNQIECVKGLMTSKSTVLLPLFVSALLKHIAFRVNLSTKVDDRVYALEKMKVLPLTQLITYIYPDLYPVHYEFNAEHYEWPSILQLSYANIQSDGAYILDAQDIIILYVCKNINLQWLNDVFGVSNFSQIPDDGDNLDLNTGKQVKTKTEENYLRTQIVPLATLNNETSSNLISFINYLINQRPKTPHFFVLRDDSRIRHLFLQYMFDDRSESSFSYYEFLQHLQQRLKN